MPETVASISLHFALHTDVGRSREHQEDRMLAAANLAGGVWVSEGSNAGTTDNWGVLLVVADGMGGMNAGEVAAQMAVDSVRRYFEKLVQETSDPAAQSPQQSLLEAMWYAQQQIVQLAAGKEDLAGMGTTLVMAWVIGQELQLLWVGDSRCYLWRTGEGLRQLSKDHSLVQKLLDEQKITHEQAVIHPQRNMITQCLGMTGDPISPGYIRQTLQINDCLLICTDGLNGMLSDKQMAVFFEEGVYESPPELATRLITAANDAGGHDNITLAVARLAPQPVIDKAASGRTFTFEGSTKRTSLEQRSSRTSKKSRLFVLCFLMLLGAGATLLCFWFSRNNSSEVLSQNLPEQKPEAQTKPADSSYGKIIAVETRTDTLQNVAAAYVPDSFPAHAATGEVKAGTHYIVVGAFANKDNIRRLERELRKRYPQYSVARTSLPSSSGEKWEVVLTGFQSNEEAENLKAADSKSEKPLLSSANIKSH